MPSSTLNTLLTNKGYTDKAKSYGIDPRGNNPLGDIFRRGSVGMFPGFAESVDFANQLEPQREKALSGALDQFNPGTFDQDARKQINHSNEQFDLGTRQAVMQQKNAGLGDGFTAGTFGAGATNKGIAANNIWGQIHSPEHLAQALSAIFSGVNQGMTSPFLQSLLSLFSPIEARQNANFQQHQMGGLNSVMPLLGMAANAFMPAPGMSAGMNPWMKAAMSGVADNVASGVGAGLASFF